VTEFLNPEFDIPGAGPGEAENWTVSVFMQNSGWAKFRAFEGFALSEGWEACSSFARLWSKHDTYDLDKAITITISSIGVSPANTFTVPGDLRKLLPPSAAFQVVGTTPGETNLDAYWTVESIEFDGTDTVITVTEDIDFDVAAEIVIPPILYLDIDNYGWGARLDSQKTYPIAALSVSDTLELSINRGAVVTVTFPGGETTAENVVDALNTQFGILGVDSDVVAVVENSVPVIKTMNQETGAVLKVTGGTAATKLDFPDGERFGFGQVAQLFSGYFQDHEAATADEIVDVLKTYIQHGYFRATDADGAERFFVRSEKTGELASVKVWGYQGEVMSDASWPITAVIPATNMLKLVIDGEDLEVTLTTGATTAEEILDDIQEALGVGSTATALIAGNGQIFIGGSVSIKVDSVGTTNANLGFIEDVIFYGNNNIHSELGFDDTESVGEYDVGFFESFDDVSALSAVFAGGTAIESRYENFEWTPVSDELLDTPVARVKSWAEWLSGGDIAVAGSGVFKIDGNKTEYYYPGASAMVQGSTANDGTYTVTTSSYSGGTTSIFVSETIPDGTADGSIYSMFFKSDADDFVQSWGTFLVDANAPPMHVYDGVVVGNEVTFPVEVQGNRNEMWIYVGTDRNLVLLRADAGTYDTAGELVAHLNAKLALQTSADLEFSVHEESDDQTSARIGFGWDGVGAVSQEIFFANQHGRHAELDMRSSIGLTHFINGEASRIRVPSSWFRNIEGTMSEKTPLHWESSPRFFDVDPDSRVSYSIETTDAGDVVVLYEGHEFALFNVLTSPDNSASEAFIPEGWGGALLEFAAWEAALGAATFNTGSPKPDVDYEDFESPWED
jgi:hypothetical protein